jgi:hypothetical protein
MTITEEVVTTARQTAQDHQQRGVSFFAEDYGEVQRQAQSCREELDELCLELPHDDPLRRVDVWARRHKTDPDGPLLSDSERHNGMGLRVSYYPSGPRH